MQCQYNLPILKRSPDFSGDREFRSCVKTTATIFSREAWTYIVASRSQKRSKGDICNGDINRLTQGSKAPASTLIRAYITTLAWYADGYQVERLNYTLINIIITNTNIAENQ